ncbi:MAG: hypothetical protein CMG41_05900 [Candidatus Marinimicrobia bacterium]|nr:hypothetical protein [Candidatus Neomarinimicrobiota bacterium]|tara:strand:- start:1117 stop:2136 length:1020 start_codon:yes stop_codon:yes gene_type:complete
MSNKLFLGLDGGATKILAQTCDFDSKSTLITPNGKYIEYSYNESNNFDSTFKPTSLLQQQKEAKKNKYKFSKEEEKQSSSIIDTIVKIILTSVKNNKISHVGLCFPGIKTTNFDGISIMANGPRSIDMLSQLNQKIKAKLGHRLLIKTIYDDSACCVIGETKSSTGKLKNCKNAIYIGGGTGIADGLILNNKLIDFKNHSGIKRSWELIMPNHESVEQCLSLGGMINQWNSTKYIPVSGIIELFNHARSGNNFANNIIVKAAKAFAFLIEKRIKFFQSHNTKPEKIIIGQRLGNIVSDRNNLLSKQILKNYTGQIPIEISTDRRTAAIGAAYKAYETIK